VGAVCSETTRDLTEYGKFDDIVVEEKNNISPENLK
jgi:hypothetical protein